LSATHSGDLREKHIGELIGELGSDTATLVRQEMALARAELTQHVDVLRSELAEALDAARTDTTQKLDQAKADLARSGKKAGIGIGMFGAAGVAAVLGLGALTACLILLLNRWLATDLAALIVALAWGLVAGAAALRGRDNVREAGAGVHPADYVPRDGLSAANGHLKAAVQPQELLPELTIETVKEDVEWAKTRGRSGAK
jgi:hypothetical protein